MGGAVPNGRGAQAANKDLRGQPGLVDDQWYKATKPGYGAGAAVPDGQGATPAAGYGAAAGVYSGAAQGRGYGAGLGQGGYPQAGVKPGPAAGYGQGAYLGVGQGSAYGNGHGNGQAGLGTKGYGNNAISAGTGYPVVPIDLGGLGAKGGKGTGKGQPSASASLGLGPKAGRGTGRQSRKGDR
ncbi:hypothetical protein GN956_G20403 [Arapaima gigas]